MKIRSLALCATALLLPLGVAACSEDSTGDLSKSEVKQLFLDAEMDDATADCMADATIEADFTESELEDINSGKTTSGEKYDAFMASVQECAMAAAGVSTGG